jgi:hypothetical protein
VPSLRDKLAEELDSLCQAGGKLFTELAEGQQAGFRSDYQGWYTRALGAVRQLTPERLDEFVELYRVGKRTHYSVSTYGISDFLLGITFTIGVETADCRSIAMMRFLQQSQILKSARSRLEDLLSNIRGLVQAELFDSQVEAAGELAEAGHLRGAGAVAGVVLERHLAEMCARRGLSLKKRHPTIADWNDKLKDAGVFDIPQWRWMQRLADLRNLCAHERGREPTKDEVVELIRATEKATKTLA